MNRLYDVEQVAGIVGLSAFTVRQAIREGELAATKLRGRWKVDPDDLAAWIDRGRDAQTRGRNARPPLPVPRPRGKRPVGGYRELARQRREAS